VLVIIVALLFFFSTLLKRKRSEKTEVYWMGLDVKQQLHNDRYNAHNNWH
jgi:hypothetical protein